MQAEFNEKLVKNLPDAFAKAEGSNNAKILEIEEAACNELRSGLREIFNAYAERPEDEGVLNINNANGKTLDLYGERVGQARGLADDDKYLLMIKAKITRGLANGSYPSVLGALCETFGCDPSQICLKDGEEPFSVDVESLPLDIIVHAGLSTSQTTALIKSLMPAGTNLVSLSYEGTFEFAEGENEYNEAAGFADDNGTVGGYFGAMQGDETDAVLPI